MDSSAGLSKYERCVQNVMGAGGLPRKLAEQYVESVGIMADEAVAKNPAITNIELETSLLREIIAADSVAQEKALAKKRAKLLNARKLIKATGAVDNGGYKNYKEGVESFYGGGLRLRKGGKNSVHGTQEALDHQAVGMLVKGLEKEGLVDVFVSGKFDKEIGRELYALDGTTSNKSGYTGSAEALGVAKVIRAVQNHFVERLNREGAYIRLMPGYIMRQWHDMGQIIRAGKEEWIAFVTPRLNVRDTLNGHPNLRQFLEDAYEGFASGTYMKTVNAEDMSDIPEHMMGADIAKKISAHRILHFKDADATLEYNEMFGGGSLANSVTKGIQRQARMLGLISKVGTKPEEFHKELLDHAIVKSAGDHKTIQALRSNHGQIQALFELTTGEADVPANQAWAQFGQVARDIQSTSKLGGMLFSSVTDTAAQSIGATNNGIPFLQSWAHTVSNIFVGKGENGKEVAHGVGAGIAGFLGSINGRFMAKDTNVGRLSKGLQKMMKINGMNWWNDKNTTGAAHALSANLGYNSGKTLDQLHPKLQKQFTMYDINAKEWDVIRSTAYHGVNGGLYVGPQPLRSVDDATIAAVYNIPTELSPRAMAVEIERARDELKNKLSTYMNDQIYSLVPHPDAKTKTLLTQGLHKGTPTGEIMSLLFQFKQFPVAMWRRTLAPIIYGQGHESFGDAWKNGKGDLLMFAGAIAQLTAMGAVANIASDVANGRTPKRMDDGKFLLAALSRGGGFGIFSDLLFSEANRYGQSGFSTLLGPTFGQVETLLDVFQDAKDGDVKLNKLLRLIENNTPFINLFYTKMAVKYLVTDELHELASPGYLRRTERRIEKEYGQSYFTPSPSSRPVWGG